MKIDIETLKRTKGIGSKTLERVIEQHELENAISAFESSYVPSLDYTLDKDVNLWLGDCIELMHHIPDKSIDLILCDLPYGVTNCEWDDIIPLTPLWRHYERIIKDSGAILLFGSDDFSTRLKNSNPELYQYDWIWLKNKPTGFATARSKPMRTHEFISVFYKEQPTYNPIKEPRDFDPSNQKALEKPLIRHGYYGSETQERDFKEKFVKEYDNLRFPTTVQKFKSVGNSKGSGRVHPTQKPVDLLEYMIKTYTDKDMLVLDNTMGSGSTGIACQNTGRRFIGIEQTEQYFEIAKGRIDENRYRDVKED